MANSLFGQRRAALREECSGIDLQAGLNTVVFKVLNQRYGWQGSVRVSDANDQPVPGLEVDLSPRNVRVTP